MEIKEGKAVLTLRERTTSGINSVGDEIVPTEEWIKDNVGCFGKEPNLFDGV